MIKNLVLFSVIFSIGFIGLIDLYLPEYQSARWALIPVTVISAITSLIGHFSNKNYIRKDNSSLIFLWASLGLFAFLSFVSLVLNGAELISSLVGLKNYFQMWPLLIVFSLIGYKIEDITKIFRLLVVLMMIQLPFVLHQFIYLAPQRLGIESARLNIVANDIVAGTFGGYMDGGGRSSNLALLSAIAITISLLLWKHSFLGRAKFFAVTILCLLPLIVSEAKLFFVLVFAAFLLSYKKELFKNPLYFAVLTAGISLLIFGLAAIYSVLPSAESQSYGSLGEYIDRMIEYNVGEAGYGGSILNRFNVYYFWWEQSSANGSILDILFGYGLGATNETSNTFAGGIAADKYFGFGIGLTAVSALLWDIGILGCVSVFLIFIAGIKLAGACAKMFSNTLIEPISKSIQISLILILISLFHNNYFVFDVAFQTIFMLMMGGVVALSKIEYRSIRAY